MISDLTHRCSKVSSFIIFFFFAFFFLGPHLQHMEVPSPGWTASLRQRRSNTGSEGPGSLQRQIPNPLSEARDWTWILMDTRWICCCCATTGTPQISSFLTSDHSWFLKHLSHGINDLNLYWFSSSPSGWYFSVSFILSLLFFASSKFSNLEGLCQF